MAEFSVESSAVISRDDVRERLSSLNPPLRIVAENVATGSSSIDFVAVDPIGDVVVVLMGRAGEDLALLTRGLSHQAWVEGQLDNWRQLAPGLDLSPRASVQVLLVCPDFSVETRSALAQVGPGIQLVRARLLRNGAQSGLLFEPLGTAPSSSPAAPQESGGGDPASGEMTFRSGLTEEDLRLSPEERREFE